MLGAILWPVVAGVKSSSPLLWRLHLSITPSVGVMDIHVEFIRFPLPRVSIWPLHPVLLVELLCSTLLLSDYKGLGP